jgi:hypothetical protein
VVRIKPYYIKLSFDAKSDYDATSRYLFAVFSPYFRFFPIQLPSHLATISTKSNASLGRFLERKTRDVPGNFFILKEPPWPSRMIALKQ